ncbi:MAG: queuosine precursor transporter [Hyphomicrobiaceae bacterium]|nr:queuosine precursor transporter [Hyphomicrobiaceae bacterium]
MSERIVLAAAILAMAAVVVLSNVLVQHPVDATLGSLQLADLLTWGAFTYPVAFLVTDLANRRLGASRARLVVIAGFVAAVVLSVWLATPRIAIASGSAFLVAQLLDVAIFDRLRRAVWWKAPVVSSLLASLVDTAIFFSLAFAASVTPILGFGDDFATGTAIFAGLEATRWVAWAFGDLAVKLLVALALLMPYRALLTFLPLKDAAPAPAR